MHHLRPRGHRPADAAHCMLPSLSAACAVHQTGPARTRPPTPCPAEHHAPAVMAIPQAATSLIRAANGPGEATYDPLMASSILCHWPFLTVQLSLAASLALLSPPSPPSRFLAQAAPLRSTSNSPVLIISWLTDRAAVTAGLLMRPPVTVSLRYSLRPECAQVIPLLIDPTSLPSPDPAPTHLTSLTTWPLRKAMVS